MKLFSSLNREQKQAIGLLQVGTFLEYFDLMLYIHMAVLLNELFFPQTDARTASLLGAFVFCLTYIFRPIGALIFGWLGDNIGRKSTIIITTVMMAISCVVMANLPTYAQIGVASAWIMTFCRMAQGMSSMGEIMGAQIYVAESVRRPACYPAVASVTICASLGATVALGVSFLVTSYYMDWRVAFWVGALIAAVGATARTRLRETADFLEMKRHQMKQAIEDLNREGESESLPAASQQEKSAWKQHVDYKTLLSFFFIHSGWPLTFYLAYVYFNPILKENFGYLPGDIIKHNFFLSILFLIPVIFLAFISYRIHPLKILKIKVIFISLLMIATPFVVMNINSPLQLFIWQALIIMLPFDSVPAEAALIYHLPIYRRFTYATFLWALTRALMYVVTSFGLIYLTGYFGYFGLWFITLPVTVAYLYGVCHFEGLERKIGLYPNLA